MEFQKTKTFNDYATSIFKYQIKLNCIVIHKRKTSFHCIDGDGRANGIKKMRGCPQRGEAGIIINLWNSKNFSSSENSRLPITSSVFNPSNEGVISGNKNGNECVHRRAQNDLPLRAILLKRGGILDCRIFDWGTQISFNDHKSFSHLEALRCVAVVVPVLFPQEQDHLRLRDCNGGKKGNMWDMVG
jgi:hypothetical protein